MHRGSRRLRALYVTAFVLVSGVVTSTGPVETVSAADPPWTTPTVPPRCSSAQANSGNVAGCLLSANPGEPESRGWPSPPFPGESGGAFPGIGWRWTGSSYNGSPALAQWEAGFVRNVSQIGSVRPGQLSSQPDALPLYEGFFSEIQARGYVVRNGSGAYSFRCTASTRKDCYGLTRRSLSNHAFGLAADLNTSQNPMQTQYGINGASACQTPMITDMPQWVVQVAEKWGLYWGGYGWSGGCSSPNQVKSSASRDPMHFEFNGTVEQARAIMCFNRGHSTFEVAVGNGIIEGRCFGGTMPPAATRMVIDTDAPAGATAAVVNLTGVWQAANGNLTAESCTGTPPAWREWSNANVRLGRAVSVTSIVQLDSLGRFCLYNSIAMHTVVDVMGFFAPSASAPNGALYTPITPTRTMDTRRTPFCTPEGVCTPLGPIPGGTEVQSILAAPVDAIATVANITVVRPSTAAFVTVDRCDVLGAGPVEHSNVNFGAGDVVANLTFTPSLSTSEGEQFCTVSSQSLHEVIDVQGFFAPAALGGLGYNSLTPSRLVDTRNCWTDAATDIERCGLLNAAGDIVHVNAPAGAKAVVVAIATVDSAPNGYVSAAPCSAIGAEPPRFSNVNAVVGSPVANSAIVPVDPDGTFCVYISQPMHVVIDLMGSFSNNGLRFMPITPKRVHDSRE